MQEQLWNNKRKPRTTVTVWSGTRNTKRDSAKL